MVISIAGLISAAYLGVHYNGKVAESIDLLAVCIMSLACVWVFYWRVSRFGWDRSGD